MAKTPIQEASEASEETQVRMSFGEHLDELRKRIMRALLGSLFGVGLCIAYAKEIYGYVVKPYKVVAAAHHVVDVMQTSKPPEAFFIPITLAIKVGLIISSPWIIYQLWQFIGAGLYQKERKIIYRYIGPSAILFLLGVFFFYFIVLPITLQFFFTFSGSGGTHANPNWLERTLMSFAAEGPPSVAPTTIAATSTTSQPGPLSIPALEHDPPAPPEGHAFLFFNSTEERVKILLHDQTQLPMVVAQNAIFINNWRAEDYLSFVAFSCLIFGLAFQLPMIILILAQIEIVQTQTFRNVRKYAYFIILVAAVIIAPSGDPFILLMLFIPLVGLYEIGILAAAFATRNRPKEEE